MVRVRMEVQDAGTTSKVTRSEERRAFLLKALEKCYGGADWRMGQQHRGDKEGEEGVTDARHAQVKEQEIPAQDKMLRDC